MTATWYRSRAIYRYLCIFGPMMRGDLRRELDMSWGVLETALISCNHHGFLLSEDDAGALHPWKVEM